MIRILGNHNQKNKTSTKMKVIFLGSQGSGKSTQAKLLAQKLNLPYIEMGQVFRDRAGNPDDLAAKIKKALDLGNLVDDEVAITTLKDELKKPQFQNGYILDGYPRNSAQLAALEPDIDKVFYINVSDEEAIKRLLLRRREDDTRKALQKRLEIYHNQTEPLLAIFKQKGNIEEINGHNSIEEIHREIFKKINK